MERAATSPPVKEGWLWLRACSRGIYTPFAKATARDWSLWGILFVVGFLLRVMNLDTSPYGDEAYYYFVAHNLGAYWDTATYPVSGSISPVYPLLYHFVAPNLLTLRVANALVGALATPMTVGVLRTLGVGRTLQVVAGGLVAVNLILVQFSGLAFLDMLGAVIGLGAIWAYVARRHNLAAALTGFAVLEKDYYAFFGVALFVDYLWTHHKLYRAMAVAGGAVGCWLLVRYGLTHASLQYLLQSHAHAHLRLGGVAKALGSPPLVPLIVAGMILGPRLRPVGYFVVAFLAFQAVWGNAQGWYWCLTAIGSILLASYGAHLLSQQRVRRPDAAALAAAAVVALFGIAFLVEAVQTRNYLANWHDHSLVNLAAYLDDQSQAKDLDLVNCFWGYQYFPLGGRGRTIHVIARWDQAAAPLVLGCPGAPSPPPDWRMVLQSGGYTLLRRPS